MKTFSFDVTLLATIQVSAESVKEARAQLREKLDGAQANFGAWPDGSPILAEVGMEGDAALVET